MAVQNTFIRSKNEKKDFLDITDFSKEELLVFLDLATELKKKNILPVATNLFSKAKTWR